MKIIERSSVKDSLFHGVLMGMLLVVTGCRTDGDTIESRASDHERSDGGNSAGDDEAPPSLEDGGDRANAASGGMGPADSGGGGEPFVEASTIVDEERVPACTAADGRPGILVDVFPYPVPEPRCEVFEQPGELDPDCPSEFLLRCSRDDCVGVQEADGCCRGNGECGLLDPGFWVPDRTLGCFSRAEWVEHAEWLGGGQVRQTCQD